MRLHIGKAFNFLKLTDYLEEENQNECLLKTSPKNSQLSHLAQYAN